MYEIEKGIEIPKAAPRGGLTKKYYFETMSIGESIFIPLDGRKYEAISSSAGSAARRAGVKVTTRRIEKDGVKGVRVWRVAPKE